MRNAYDRIDTVEGLVDQLHQYAGSAYANPIRGALICTEKANLDLLSVFSRRAPSMRVLWSTDAAQLIKLSERIGEPPNDTQLSGQALLVPTLYSQIHLLISVDSSEFVSKALWRMVDRCWPTLANPFITAKSLVSILRELRAASDLKEFTVKQLAARSRIEGKKEGRKLRAERIWTEESLEQVLSTLRERGQWLHSAEFEYSIQEGRKVRKHVGHLSRHCAFRAKSDFRWFYRNAIERQLDQAAKTLEFYSNRARVPDKEARPIVIEYSEPLFQDKIQIRRLGKSLRSLPHSTLSVLHSNPYFRASIVDFDDGSSYEVWVLSHNRIIVTPQFRATFASVEKVCDHILSSFGEGDLKNMDQIHVAG